MMRMRRRSNGPRYSPTAVRVLAAMGIGSLWFASLANTHQALADEFYGFAQVTCVSEISYFSARRFQLVNLPHDPPKTSDRDSSVPVLATVASRHGIYAARDLKDRPVECDLPAISALHRRDARQQPLKVRVIGIFNDDNGRATSERQIEEYAEIWAGEKLIGRLFMNTYGFQASGTDLIEIFHDGVSFQVRICTHEVALDRKKGGCSSALL